MLVQSSFCLGLAAGALQEAAKHLDVSKGIFRPEFPLILSEYESLREELIRLASEPERAERRDLLSLRLNVSDAVVVNTVALYMQYLAYRGRRYFYVPSTHQSDSELGI